VAAVVLMVVEFLEEFKEVVVELVKGGWQT